MQGLFAIALVVVLSSLTACKTETSKSTTPTNAGWIKIETPTAADTYSIDTSSDTIALDGRSFHHTVCYTDSTCDTKVIISWKNLTTGQSGTGTSSPKFCWLFGYYVCGATWSATPTIALGNNEIEVKAVSGSESGTARIVITRTDSSPPVITSINPANGSTGVATDITIVVNFNEPIDTSFVSDRTLSFIDSDGNPVAGTIVPTSSFITFKPDSTLAHSSSYTVTVKAYWLKDLAGNLITADTSSTFTTVDRTWSSFTLSVGNDSSSVWTGSKIVTWGAGPTSTTGWGQVYDPGTDSAFLVSPVNAPRAGINHSAIWTGSEMIIWGGYEYYCDGTCRNVYYDAGGRYDPDTNTWVPTSTTNSPSPRSGHTAIWTGTKMIVWGGSDGGSSLNTGGIYDPATDTWTPIATKNAPTDRASHSAVWTGTEMIVWGGYKSGTGGGFLNDGARYNPATDTWTPITTTNAPSARRNHAAVWTGTEMVIWGSGYVSFGTPISNGGTIYGGKYNPATDTWVPTSTLNVPEPRAGFTTAWTGSEMLIWGGQRAEPIVLESGFTFVSRKYLNSMGIYNPTTDTWRTFPTQNTPAGRYRHTATWTGTQLVVMGGVVDDGIDSSNADLQTDTGGKITVYP